MSDSDPFSPRLIASRFSWEPTDSSAYAPEALDSAFSWTPPDNAEDYAWRKLSSSLADPIHEEIKLKFSGGFDGYTRKSNADFEASGPSNDYPADADAAVRDAAIAFLFHVQVGGEAIGDFQLIDGLDRKMEPFQFAEGGRNDSPVVRVAPFTHGPVTLRWGLMNRDALWAWCEEVEVGRSFRRDVQIIQLTRYAKVIRTYTLEDAFPVGWKGARLDASASESPVEELQLQYKRITVSVRNPNNG